MSRVARREGDHSWSPECLAYYMIVALRSTATEDDRPVAGFKNVASYLSTRRAYALPISSLVTINSADALLQAIGIS